MNVYGIFDKCVMGYITIFTERDEKWPNEILKSH